MTLTHTWSNMPRKPTLSTVAGLPQVSFVGSHAAVSRNNPGNQTIPVTVSPRHPGLDG